MDSDTKYNVKEIAAWTVQVLDELDPASDVAEIIHNLARYGSPDGIRPAPPNMRIVIVDRRTGVLSDQQVLFFDHQCDEYYVLDTTSATVTEANGFPYLDGDIIDGQPAREVATELAKQNVVRAVHS